MDLKETIKSHAKDLGIDKIGFTTADDFAALKSRWPYNRFRTPKSG